MEVKQVVVVGVIKRAMKYFFQLLFGLSLITSGFSQTPEPYKKKVLESTEIQSLFSYYAQQGIHGAVGGGLGSEELVNTTPTIVVTVPLNEDVVLTVDSGISTYTSASSSNINPFMSVGVLGTQAKTNSTAEGGLSRPQTWAASGASSSNNTGSNLVTMPIGTPWFASSGASRKDALKHISASISESSDDRNTIKSAELYASTEYDYQSFGFGAGWARLFNEKNTEISLKAKVYLDQWYPIYPTELHEYGLYGTDFLNRGYFNGVNVLNQDGQTTNAYLPSQFTEWKNSNRSSGTLSLSFSQILSRRIQVSLSTDVVYQTGLLSTPYHRIYFKDRPNYYIGDASFIDVYDTTKNFGVFRLADDIERLPESRVKIPIGGRLNMYVNDWLTLRSFYRYYFDDWGIQAQTASLEMPIKLSMNWTVYPSFRYYEQSAAEYFKPFGEHLSTQQFYTSDYDLSSFTSSQLGFGISYKDIFTNIKAFGFGLKNVDFRFQHYYRSDGLESIIYGIGVKFVQ